MSGANVLSIGALEDLKAGLSRFGSEVGEMLRAAATEIEQTLEWLNERLRYWQLETRRCEESYSAAQAAFRACLNAASKEGGGCGAYEARAAESLRRLRAAQNELENVRRYGKVVQAAAEDFTRQAQRLNAYVSDDLPKANALLGRKVDSLHAYAGLSAPLVGGATNYSAPQSSGVASSGPGSFGTASSAGSGSGEQEQAPVANPERGFSTPKPIEFDDFHYQDRAGRTLALRTTHLPMAGGATYHLLIDDVAADHGPSGHNVARSGMTFIDDAAGTRLHLGWIEVDPPYRGAGSGELLLERAEIIARHGGAREIYGEAPPDAETRSWYERHGFSLREDGREIYKTFSF